jgi:hypothetical protein
VVSVTSPANVTHWIEENDDEIHDSLYWRQALDYRTLELSVCTNHPVLTLGLLANNSYSLLNPSACVAALRTQIRS